MKFEVEISDDLLRAAAEKHVAEGLGKSGYGGWLQSLIEARVKAHFAGADLTEAIKKRIGERAEDAINRAVDQKLDGWIKRQVAECLKAADLMQRAAKP
jgi:predicted Holliday junction resolvase-like endonuclease